MKEFLKNIIAIFALVGPIVSIICYSLDLYEACAISAFLGAIGFWGMIIIGSQDVTNAKGNGHYPPYDWL